MSKFFQALEQAERERALREAARTQGATPADSAPPATTLPGPTPVEDRPTRSESRPAPTGPATVAAPSEPAVVGVARKGIEEHLVSLTAPTSQEAEQYRVLRHLIEQLHASANLGVVAVTSPAAGDGKTTTAINLAGALAQNPAARVLLLDADLRGSAVLRQLGLDARGTPGLVDALLEPSLELERVTVPCPPFNLAVLPAGRATGIPYELLRSPRLGELLRAARERYSYVVLDTSPVALFPDGRVIAGLVDGFVLVVAAHKTPRRLVEEALTLMEGAKLVGLVFNGDSCPLARYYRDAYASGPGSRNGGPPRGMARVLAALGRYLPGGSRHRRAR